MHGYAASARIDEVRVRARDALAAPLGPMPAVDADTERLAPSPVSETPDPGPFEQLLADLRTQWEQTTFYLFDPESWR